MIEVMDCGLSIIGDASPDLGDFIEN